MEASHAPPSECCRLILLPFTQVHGLKFDISYDLFAIFSYYTNINITGIFLQP